MIALSSVTVQSGLCEGRSQEIMLCVISESEMEVTLERGFPLAEAHEWIARPSPDLEDTLGLSSELQRKIAPQPTEAAGVLAFSAADFSRHLNLAATAFRPGDPLSASGLNLTAIGLVPEAKIPVAQKELSGYPIPSSSPSSSHQQPEEPSAEASPVGALGVVIRSTNGLGVLLLE